jgi:hypothetical protein
MQVAVIEALGHHLAQPPTHLGHTLAQPFTHSPTLTTLIPLPHLSPAPPAPFEFQVHTI